VSEQLPGFDAVPVIVPEAAETTLPRRILLMYARHGSTEGQTCRTCAHLQRYKQGTRWMKCELTRQTSGAATDWRAGWPACGKWESCE
jgi:hypothetical protein